MSYRPKVKGDAQGTVTDLPLDAETVKGVDVVAQLQNKSNVGHTHDNRYVRFDTWDQDLTELQKIQARVNIGAGTSSFSGSYNDLTDKPDECIKTVPMYIDDDDKYIFLWGLKEDTHTLYFLPEGTYYVYARGTNFSDRDGYIGTFFGPATLTIHSMGSSELRYNLYDGYGQGIGYGSVHKYPSTITSDYYEYSPIVKANENAQTGTIHAPLYIKYTSPTYTDGATYKFAECSLYAGGTNVTLNGTSKSATTASFYAPTTAGSSGQFLKSAGANASPTWVNLATVATSGSYNDLSNKPTIPTKSSWNYDDVYVKYNAAQTLTDAQKSQARTNIGAGTSSLAIGTTASTAAAGNHTHSTTLATSNSAATVTMAPNTTYKLSTGGTSVVFKTPSDAYKIAETLRKGSEADTAVGYYKIATINHVSWNFCQFTMILNNTYAGTVYTSMIDCRCSDSGTNLNSFALNIIAGTDISNKLAYLYTFDSSNNLIKVEVFIHATRFEHPTCYIINARHGQQLVIPTEDEFSKATPDKPDGTTMTGNATYDLALKSDIPTRVTGSWTVSTTNPGPMVDIILAHPDIKIYYKTYSSTARTTDIASVLFNAHHNVKQGIYSLTLRYVNTSGSLTTIVSGTIYYEYFE